MYTNVITNPYILYVFVTVVCSICPNISCISYSIRAIYQNKLKNEISSFKHHGCCVS